MRRQPVCGITGEQRRATRLEVVALLLSAERDTHECERRERAVAAERDVLSAQGRARGGGNEMRAARAKRESPGSVLPRLLERSSLVETTASRSNRVLG
jgi:hypothetical protein